MTFGEALYGAVDAVREAVEFDGAITSLFALDGNYSEERHAQIGERITTLASRIPATRVNVARILSREVAFGVYRLDDVLARYEKRCGVTRGGGEQPDGLDDDTLIREAAAEMSRASGGNYSPEWCEQAILQVFSCKGIPFAADEMRRFLRTVHSR